MGQGRGHDPTFVAILRGAARGSAEDRGDGARKKCPEACSHPTGYPECPGAAAPATAAEQNPRRHVGPKAARRLGAARPHRRSARNEPRRCLGRDRAEPRACNRPRRAGDPVNHRSSPGRRSAGATRAHQGRRARLARGIAPLQSHSCGPTRSPSSRRRREPVSRFETPAAFPLTVS